MRRLITFITLIFITMSLFAQKKQISNVEQTSSWIYVYDSNGKRCYTQSSNAAGTLVGFCTDYYVTCYNNSWYYFWDANGKRLLTRNVNTVGEIIGVTNNNWTTRYHNSWIYTFDLKGNRINARPASVH